MALWSSIMACSQSSDVTVSLSRRYRPLVWLAAEIWGRKPDSTQIASMQDEGKAEINQRDERRWEDRKDQIGVCVGGGEGVVCGLKEIGGWLKGQIEQRCPLKGQQSINKFCVCVSVTCHIGCFQIHMADVALLTCTSDTADITRSSTKT